MHVLGFSVSGVGAAACVVEMGQVLLTEGGMWDDGF